ERCDTDTETERLPGLGVSHSERLPGREHAHARGLAEPDRDPGSDAHAAAVAVPGPDGIASADPDAGSDRRADSRAGDHTHAHSDPHPDAFARAGLQPGHPHDLHEL